MGDEKPQGNLREWEWVLAQLVRRESGEAEPLDEPEESTIRGIEAQLETLVDQIRQSPPVDDFAEESGCQRAIELVEQLPQRPELSSADVLPQHIGPYQVLARLRQGGMGTVYKALHPKLQRVVAIKVLPKFRTSDAAAVARFEREMQTLGGLSHRNIVAATDAGEVDGMQYLVMEYVDGIDLSTLVRRVGPLAISDACEIVRQAAEGVAEAHRRGIVHRDIKPSNLILVDGAGEQGGATVKVLDFGLARLAAEFADDELTNSGQIMGTLKYMAPEQCSNSRDVDARADVYSLGATLYRLLTGKAPFSGTRFDSPPALVAALANETPERVRSLRGELSPQLAAIVECMMAKEPAKRYATPDEVIESLEPWSRGSDLAGLLARARAADDGPPPPRLFREPRPATGTAANQVDSRTVARSHLFVWAAVVLGGALIALLAFVNASLFDSTPPGQEAQGQAAAPNPDVDPFERSREVVDWLLARPTANCTLTISGQGDVELKAGDAVPDRPFQLVAANLDGDKALSDEDLARFDQLPHLISLGLGNTEIDDDGLRRLGYLPMLETLFLVETNVGDAGVAELKKYPAIRLIHLYGTDVTDKCLKSLASANKQLTELSLVDCNITDRGLAALVGLKQLRLLALDRTGVTLAGVARLQIALPDCEIRSDFSAADIAAEMERQRAESRPDN